MPAATAEHVLSVLVATGRAVPAYEWVESVVARDAEAARDAAAARLPHHTI